MYTNTIAERQILPFISLDTRILRKERDFVSQDCHVAQQRQDSTGLGWNGAGGKQSGNERSSYRPRRLHWSAVQCSALRCKAAQAAGFACISFRSAATISWTKSCGVGVSGET